MRALADFVMRGRMQATITVAGAALIPLLMWLSAAAGSLVLLRRGLNDALGVLTWAVLPGLLWWYLGDPSVLLVLLGTLTLAQVLRASVSWRRVLLASVAVGVVFALVLGSVFADAIQALVDEFQKLLPQVLGPAYSQLSADEQVQLQQLLRPVLTGLMAAFFQTVCLLCLVLGRYWQALLYNPGGFGREFRALHLSPALGLGLFLAMLLAPNLGLQLGMLTPICSVPLALAGVALLHGLVAIKGAARFWLVGFYVVLLVFGQLVYPLLVLFAVVDSLFDFRGRLVRRQGSTNGEG
jgi:hypothetical protein